MTRFPSCSVQNIWFVFCARQFHFQHSFFASSASFWLNINDDLQFWIYLFFSLACWLLTFISCMHSTGNLFIFGINNSDSDVKHAQHFQLHDKFPIWNADLSKWQFKDLFYVFYYYALYALHFFYLCRYQIRWQNVVVVVLVVTAPIH